MAHLSHVQKAWVELGDLVQGKKPLLLDGQSLNLAAVVASARYSIISSVLKSEELAQRLRESITTLAVRLERGEQVYGVNTGCGGNADTRTTSLQVLQHSFLQHQQCGILPGLPEMESNGSCHMSHGDQRLPEEFVRGAILIRCNSLLRGHSAIRIEIIEMLLELMNNGMTPIIPLRGSISASGDLSPLSYVGGLVEGNPGIFVTAKDLEGRPCILSADSALRQANVPAMTLNAKEGLALVNGTAVSAAVGALVLYDSHNLAVLTQVLTAMATEALLGTIDNYHEFISQCRQHPGQTEVARNIRSFLTGSRFSQEADVDKLGLVQDRYSLRTAPQWIGPLLEDLLLADRQMTVEINSSTDNPLIDVAAATYHHGGNFQAASVTSAMEKTRTALMMLRKLLQSQCGELINPTLSKGLPPNLCADDPSLSFTAKGLDVNMTAYFSELAYLANSVPSHVQTAEMNNQSVNSLALISARYTSESVQLLSMMCAVHLYILCQALDLRALTMEFLSEAQLEAEILYTKIFLTSETHLSKFAHVWSDVAATWSETATLDLHARCERVALRSFGYILHKDPEPATPLCKAAKSWENGLPALLLRVYSQTRERFSPNPSTASYLGNASKVVYQFIRTELAIPFHQGVRDHPVILDNKECVVEKMTIGSYVSRIYVAVREGRVINSVYEIVNSGN